MGLIHLTIRWEVTRQNWVTRCSPHVSVFRPGIYIFRLVIVTVWCPLESKGPIYGIGRETFVFLVKVLKPLGIFFIMKLHMFQLSHFEREAPFFRGQLPSSRFFLKSTVLRRCWLKSQIFLNFLKLITLFTHSR